MTDSVKSIEGSVSVNYSSPACDFSEAGSYANTACVAATSALASAYAGDTSLVPKYVAFLYSNERKDLAIDASTTWQSVIDSGYSINRVDFSYRATVDDNKVTFHARTEGIPDSTIYAACLLGKSPKSSDSFEVLAIVDLGEKQKPTDFELSIDWTVKFNSGAVVDTGDSEEEYLS